MVVFTWLPTKEPEMGTSSVSFWPPRVGNFHGGLFVFFFEKHDSCSREKTKRKKKLILGTKIGMVVHSLKQTVRPCK